MVLLLSCWACVLSPPPHPQDLSPAALCAQYMQMGDLERAEEACDRGLQFAPQYGELWTQKGNIALQRGQEELAKAHYTKALSYNPEHASAHQNLGYIYLKNRHYGQAYEHLQLALKINPDYAEARYNLALTYRAMDRKENARKELLTLTEIYPNLADPRVLLGQWAFEEGNAGAAIEYFKQAIAIAPPYAEAWLALGNAYMEAGNACEAAHAYSSCMAYSSRMEGNASISECPPNFSFATKMCQGVALPYMDFGKPKTSAKTPEGQYALARIYIKHGLKNEAQKAYGRCLRYNNTYAPCYYGLFEIFHEEGDERKARIACRNFLKFSKRSAFSPEYETCRRLWPMPLHTLDDTLKNFSE